MNIVPWVLLAVCSGIIIILLMSMVDATSKTIAVRLLNLIKDMIKDEKLLETIFDLVVQVSSHQLSGSDKKKAVMNVVEEEYKNIDLFMISRIIDLAVNYLKLTGKINGHKNYTGTKIEKTPS
jgi:hypothetical protein